MRSKPDSSLLGLVQPWIVSPPTDVVSTRMFTLRSRRARSPVSGKEGVFDYLDAPDWAHVAAITSDRRVVMIEQYRHGTGEVTLELPGGCIDEGESPAEACARELLEETGYSGEPVEIIGRVSSNPALMNNHTHTGLVLNARPASGQNLDATEEIGVRVVPLDEVPSLIRAGVIHHSLVVAGFHYLSLRLREG